jgi:hypothetical protein
MKCPSACGAGPLNSIATAKSLAFGSRTRRQSHAQAVVDIHAQPRADDVRCAECQPIARRYSARRDWLSHRRCRRMPAPRQKQIDALIFNVAGFDSISIAAAPWILPSFVLNRLDSINQRHHIPQRGGLTEADAHLPTDPLMPLVLVVRSGSLGLGCRFALAFCLSRWPMADRWPMAAAWHGNQSTMWYLFRFVVMRVLAGEMVWLQAKRCLW